MSELANHRLDSWKEIADYLGRDVRTVIRWEKNKALPVHRIPGGQRQGVFAYTTEIDSWLRGQALDGGHEVPPPENGKGYGINGVEVVLGNTPGVGAPAAPAPSDPPLGLERPRRALPFLLGITLGVALTLAGGWVFSPLMSRPAVRVTFSANRLYAWDDRGQLAWEYAFPQPLDPKVAMENTRMVRFVDFDGDGRPYLVMVAAHEHSHSLPPRSIVYCFSPAGKLLWNYEPKYTLEFSGKQFEGPWWATDMLVSPGPRDRKVWVAFAHETWWPSVVVRLDRKGGATPQFVNSGTIHMLEYMQNASGGYVLAAGTNNEYQSAALAVFREDQSPSHSIQTHGGDYECTNCPTGWPAEYLLFPPSELFRVQGESFHHVASLNVRQAGFEVQTHEVTLRQADFSYISAVYEFRPDFQLVAASMGDAYWDLHRTLEKEGKVDHPAERCPDRIQPLRVRTWTSAMGWQQLTPSPSVAQKN
jgi:hypothetical protein